MLSSLLRACGQRVSSTTMLRQQRQRLMHMSTLSLCEACRALVQKPIEGSFLIIPPSSEQSFQAGGKSSRPEDRKNALVPSDCDMVEPTEDPACNVLKRSETVSKNEDDEHDLVGG